MKDMNAMRKVEKSVYEFLKEKHLCGAVYAVNELVLAVEINWGDWKHEHLRCNWLMEEWAKLNNRIIVVGGEEVTEEDGSDTYSAIHKYAIVG